MRKTEYDIPIFDDEDEADLNKYSELIAELLKRQLDCFYEKETVRQGDEEKRKSAELLREKSEKERTSNEKTREEAETLREEYAKTLKGIRSIELVDGTHKSGELDTYRITYTDDSSKDIQIYNGKDGKGSGDMQKSVYDTNDDGIVEEADHAKTADTATNATKVNNHKVEKDVPSNAIFTDTTYSEATPEQEGLMSPEDKKKLDEIIEKIQGTVLYEDEKGTVDTITLKDNASNYKYIEIFYYMEIGGGGKIYSSIKVNKIGDVQLSLARTVTDNNIQLYTRLINITGNLIKTVRSCFYTFQGSSNPTVGSADNLFIQKVVGYK